MIDDPLNRLKVKRGTQLPQAKLNESTVRLARQEYENARQEIQRIHREYSIKGLAKKYGVSPTTMEKALSGATWSHVI